MKHSHHQRLSRHTTLWLSTCATLAMTSGCIFFQDGTSNTSTPPEEMGTSPQVDMADMEREDQGPAPGDMASDMVDLGEPIDEGMPVDEGVPIDDDMGSTPCENHSDCGSGEYCDQNQACELCSDFKFETICRADADNFRCKVDPIPSELVTHCAFPTSTKTCVCPTTMSATCDTTTSLCEPSCIDDDELAMICSAYTTTQQASYQKLCDKEFALKRCTGAPMADIPEFVHINTKITPQNSPQQLGISVTRSKSYMAASTKQVSNPSGIMFRLYKQNGKIWEPQPLMNLITPIQAALEEVDSNATFVAIGEHVAFLGEDILVLSINYKIDQDTHYDVLMVRLSENGSPQLIDGLKLPTTLNQPIVDMDASGPSLALGVGTGEFSSVRLYRLKGDELGVEKLCTPQQEGRFKDHSYRNMGTQVQVLPPQNEEAPAAAVFVAQRRRLPTQQDYVVDLCTRGNLDEVLTGDLFGGITGRALYEASTPMADPPLIAADESSVHIADRSNKTWSLDQVAPNSRDIPTFSAKLTIDPQDYADMQAIDVSADRFIAYTTDKFAITLNEEQSRAGTRTQYLPAPMLEGRLYGVCLSEDNNELLLGNPAVMRGSVYQAEVQLK